MRNVADGLKIRWPSMSGFVTPYKTEPTFRPALVERLCCFHSCVVGKIANPRLRVEVVPISLERSMNVEPSFFVSIHKLASVLMPATEVEKLVLAGKDVPRALSAIA
jgi:hypothetical protein